MLWTATIVSNMGTGMHEVASGWLMTQLAPDPLMVAMVCVANTLPFFVLALPAGALADLLDRRKYLLGTQLFMMLAAALTAVLMGLDCMTPWRLLACTYLLALGGAMNSPAWHAVTPEIVDAEQLPRAVTANSAAINVAKALGPALGGLIVVHLGATAAFLLNSVSFLAVVGVLYSWKRPSTPMGELREPFFSAMRQGLQYVANSPYFRTVVVRSSVFVFNGNALFGLLPLICRKQFSLSGEGYGLAVALYGLGAVMGSLLFLPRLRRWWTANQVVERAWLAFIPVLLGASYLPRIWIPMLWAGICWSCILSSCHLAAQSLAPSWVRARAMSVYLLCFFFAASAGSFFWGLVAAQVGLPTCLVLSACTSLVGALSSRRAPLMTGECFALSAAGSRPQPPTAEPVPLDCGPVMVCVEYEIDPLDAAEFRETMERVRRLRYRNGALRWGLFVDLENPRLQREVYLEESWAAYLRQHQRATDYDAIVLERAGCYHRGEQSPRVQLQASANPGLPLDYGLSPEERKSPRPAPHWFLC